MIYFIQAPSGPIKIGYTNAIMLHTCRIGPYVSAVLACSHGDAAMEAASQWWAWVAPSSDDAAVDVEVSRDGEAPVTVTVSR